MRECWRWTYSENVLQTSRKIITCKKGTPQSTNCSNVFIDQLEEDLFLQRKNNLIIIWCVGKKKRNYYNNKKMMR